MRPRPTADESRASVESVIHIRGSQHFAYKHADPAGVCLVKGGLHHTLRGAESCASNSFQIAWKRERAATRK